MDFALTWYSPSTSYLVAGCFHLGARRPEGSFWYDNPQRPCVRYTCTNSQVVEVNRTECSGPPGPSCQPVLLPGDCCEMYDCSGGQWSLLRQWSKAERSPRCRWSRSR